MTKASPAAADQPASDSKPAVLTAPAGGLPSLIDSPKGLAKATRALVKGSGPIAIDAERAHGFRYSQRAYLIQLRRAGAGTHLIDPIAFDPAGPAGAPVAADRSPSDGTLAGLGAAIADSEWIIHAASQDLRCLAEVGLLPTRLFDTELAGRLLNYPRVGLGTMVEELLGVRLLKEHSAADWSTRPLPTAWLTYAALDVELLIELRNILAAQLIESGKDDWAAAEFEFLVAGAGAPVEPRSDPWRRTSGIHKVKSRRGLAYVAQLWTARDQIARAADRSPSKILPDIAITELAATPQPNRAALEEIAGFQRRQARRHLAEWLGAISRAAALSDRQLPPQHIPSGGPPQPRLWASRDPAAAERLGRAREALAELSVRHQLPVENLLTPDFVRQLAWAPPEPTTVDTVDAALAKLGARNWQRQLATPGLTAALRG